MKLIVNESNQGIRIPREDGGTLKLRPKGQTGDKQEIDDLTAASEPVQRLKSASKVSLLSPEEAATRAAAEKKALPEKKKVEEPKVEAPKPEKVEEPKVEAPKPAKVEEPKVEAPKPEKVEEPKVEEQDDNEGSTKKSKKKSKKR